MKHGLFKSGMVLLAAGILLSGCVLFDGSRRSGPDEFGVVSRAPLSQPPDYSLRPPRAGAARPNVETPRDDAQKQLLSGSQPPKAKVSSASGVPTIVAPALTGPAGASVKDRVPTGAPAAAKGVQAASGISQGELALLEQAGATQVDPKIRTLVDRESGRVKEEEALVDNLVFGRDTKSKEATINPSGGTAPLSQNAAPGQSLDGKSKPSDGK